MRAAALRGPAVLLVVLWGGCQSQPPWPEDAGEALAAIESEMMTAPTLSVDFHVEAEGAIPATFDGSLAFDEGEGVRLAADGSFIEIPQQLRITSEDGVLRGTTADSLVFGLQTPPRLREALLLGMTRMGLLHTLARLTAGQPPDHMHDGVEGWTEASDPAWGEPGTFAGREAQALTFTLRTAGTEAAEVTLWLDADTGRLAGREQTVFFPGGTMEVTERYDAWQLGDAVR